jgi:hypothetical protein
MGNKERYKGTLHNISLKKNFLPVQFFLKKRRKEKRDFAASFISQFLFVFSSALF